ncbi:hypothetical protein L1785_04025 [Antribacter sp. KLBMP9083]|uniref:Uncharacterized protein n=1 Tax=Antribacter soli TaxID=2910976 RepID=A0AA41QB09_9MICO|nr:hypothetical protein [Antribacter soli]MCF4120139.1 hypothetical protein [Antribacter soli]
MSQVEKEQPRGLPLGAKIAIVAVAVLAVGGVGTALWLARSASPEAAAPTPAASVTSPSSEPTPSPSAEPTPSATVVVSALTDPVFRDGATPDFWGEGSGVTAQCGMPIEDLVAQASTDDFRMETSGAVAETDGRYSLPLRITETAGRSDAEYQAGDPKLVWVQDGRVVDITVGWNEGAGAFHVTAPGSASFWDGEPVEDIAAGMTIDTLASGYREWVCGDIANIYENNLISSFLTYHPAGTYEVRAITWYGRGTHDDYRNGILLSDAVTVTVGEPPAPAAKFREGFAPAADSMFPLSGTGITCGMAVADLPESDPRYAVAVHGDPSFDYPAWTLPIHVTSDGSGAGGSLIAVLLWVQGGVVVDVGTDDTLADWSVGAVTLVPGGTDDVAVGAAVDTCMPEADGETFRSYRPAGGYEVIPLVRLSYSADSPVVLGDPVPVTVGAYGRP